MSTCLCFILLMYSLYAAPSGVGSVSLTASTSSSLSLTWGSPATPNGLITQYYIQATPITSVEDHTGVNIHFELERFSLYNMCWLQVHLPL